MSPLRIMSKYMNSRNESPHVTATTQRSIRYLTLLGARYYLLLEARLFRLVEYLICCRDTASSRVDQEWFSKLINSHNTSPHVTATTQHDMKNVMLLGTR